MDIDLALITRSMSYGDWKLCYHIIRCYYQFVVIDLGEKNQHLGICVYMQITFSCHSFYLRHFKDMEPATQEDKSVPNYLNILHPNS